MIAAFLVKELTADRITQAFPLVQALYGDTSVACWADFARAHLSNRVFEPPQTGIVAAENAEGYIQGLFCYRVTDQALRGRTLICDHFIAFDLAGFNSPLPALTEVAETVARRNNCAIFSVSLPGWALPELRRVGTPHAWLLDAGHRMDSLRFYKPVAPAAESPT